MSKPKWTPAKIDAKVRQISSDELGKDEDAITPDAHFLHDLNADSLDFVEIVMVCEDAFKIEIDDADMERFFHVRDLTKYLAKRLVKP